MKANEFLLTPGPLPWRLDCMKRNPKSGVVYAADLAPFANVGVRASLHHPPANEA